MSVCRKSKKFSETKLQTESREQKTMSASHIDLSDLKGHVINGVLISCEAAIKISCRRGIPRVTFISPRPARWNVFKLKENNKEKQCKNNKHN